MKHSASIMATLFLLSASTSAMSNEFINNENDSDITFEINGIKSTGKIYVQLFKGEQNYNQGIAHNASVVTVKKGSTQVAFSNLAQGEYALRYFHDKNNNGKLETNLFGMPTEGYGFSNNAKPNFGPVGYDEIKFHVGAGEQVTNNSEVIY